MEVDESIRENIFFGDARFVEMTHFIFKSLRNQVHCTASHSISFHTIIVLLLSLSPHLASSQIPLLLPSSHLSISLLGSLEGVRGPLCRRLPEDQESSLSC